MATLRWDHVRALRLARHHLTERAPRRQLAKVMSDVCGVHAQLMSSAELALWARVDGLAQGDVARALWSRRSMVKTWAMRGTLHLFAASDFPLYATALATRDYWRGSARLRHHGLTLAQAEGVVEAIAAALDGRALTRPELAELVARSMKMPFLRTKLASGWGELLKPAAYQGALCFGPSRGQNVTFVRPDQWLGRPLSGAPEEALAEVARRFLGAYGPATHQEFARWWECRPGGPPGTSSRPIRTGSGDRRGGRAGMDGQAGCGPSPLPSAAVGSAAPPGLRSVRRRGQAEGGPGRRAVRSRVFRPQAWISPVLLVDGMAAGTWQHRRRGERLEVRIDPFLPLRDRTKRAVTEGAERLAEFLGGRLDLAVGSFEAGRRRDA